MTEKTSQPAALVAGITFGAGMLTWLACAVIITAYTIVGRAEAWWWAVWALTLPALVVGAFIVYGIVQAATKRRRKTGEVQNLKLGGTQPYFRPDRINTLIERINESEGH